jgi:cell division transport system permease protein
MLAISIVLLYNTIRLAIYSRREAINTMKMVGATRWFIIKPFLAKSGWQGLVAGLLASALFVAALYGLDHTLPELGLTEQLGLLGIVIGAMVVVSVAVAMLFTLFTVNRFVNMQSNKIHLY